MWSSRALLTFYSGLAVLVAAIVLLFPRRPVGDAARRPVGDAARRPVGDAARRPVGDAAKRPAGTEGPRPALVWARASRREAPADGRIGLPIAGLARAELRDSFIDRRAGHRHEAIDIPAPRGTPVLAVDDGFVRKIFESVPGGHTVYEFNRDETLCYYYAHLQGYAGGLREGQRLLRGDVIGYVGTSGNAPPNAPHLHFAVSRLGSDKHWWEGVPIDPYPMLVNGR